MARDGSGGYDRVANTPYATGTTISSTVVNNEMVDLGNEIANSLAKDGQTTVTANLPMATFRHTGVGNSAARTDYASAADVQDGTLIYLTSVAGTNTITATAANSMTAYAAGQKFHFIVANTNTGATTINLNSIGAKAITKNGTTALAGGELVADSIVVVVYDGTQFQIISNNTGITVASGYTRVTPNFCVKTATTANWAFTNSLSSGSNTIAAPTGAAYVRFKFHIVLSTGSSYSVAWVFARDSTQTYSYDRVQFDIAENALSGPEASGELLAPVSGGNVYLTYTYSGTQATVYYEMTEYYD